jgi:hypothetical protein
MRTIAGAVRIVLATVMAQSNGLTAEEPIPWLDQSGLAALVAGSLVVLITFFTSYSHVDIPSHASIRVNQQIGIPLLLDALAALVGEVKLASNNRCADQRDRIEARIRATEARNRSAVDEVGRRPKLENARLAALESKLDSLLLSADSSSPIPPATDCN